MKLSMQVLFVVAVVSCQGQAAPATSSPPSTQTGPAPAPVPLTPEEEAARNARYYFSSDVDDQISDLTQHRDEQRDGLKVKGSYSYSDGFFWRRVVYEADENGYRVISDEMAPLDGGPNGDPDGSASVFSQVDGAQTNYTLTTPQKKTSPTESSQFDSQDDNETVTSYTLEVTAPQPRN